MKDEAVAPVVAVMLILAVVVTFLAVYNAVIVPSMKAEAEVTHIQDVEESFLHFATDIESAVALKRTLQLSEVFSLGGGQTLVNEVRSGGTLSVSPENKEIFSVVCNGSSYECRLVNVSYDPVASFWQDQGYAWQYDYLNVTQGQVETPLLYTDMKEVAEHVRTSGFFGTLVEINAEDGFFPINRDNADGNGTYTESIEKRCTDVTLSVVNLSTGGKTATSGNGPAMLILNVSTGDPVIIDAPDSLSINVNTQFIGSDAALPCGEPVWENCNRSFTELSKQYPNIDYNPGTGGNMTVFFDNSKTPVEVRIQRVNITVSVC